MWWTGLRKEILDKIWDRILHYLFLHHLCRPVFALATPEIYSAKTRPQAQLFLYLICPRSLVCSKEFWNISWSKTWSAWISENDGTAERISRLCLQRIYRQCKDRIWSSLWVHVYEFFWVSNFWELALPKQKDDTWNSSQWFFGVWAGIVATWESRRRDVKGKYNELLNYWNTYTN